mmetsp:Transcript_39124/g.57133  ORF Transcript_39124/g.57133 Transcript_39124/m.57133 type:complete len:164 (+) Transcript_39124:51-542(+)
MYMCSDIIIILPYNKITHLSLCRGRGERERILSFLKNNDPTSVSIYSQNYKTHPFSFVMLSFFHKCAHTSPFYFLHLCFFYKALLANISNVCLADGVPICLLQSKSSPILELSGVVLSADLSYTSSSSSPSSFLLAFALESRLPGLITTFSGKFSQATPKTGK